MTEDNEDAAGNLFGTDAAWEVPAMGLNMPTGSNTHSMSEPVGFMSAEYAQGAELLNAVSEDAELVTEPGVAAGITGNSEWATPAEEPFVVVEETEDAKASRITEEVQTWDEAKVASTAAVAAEREARAKLAATCFPTPKKGTQRFALPGGWNVKLVHGWNYKIGLKDKMSDQGIAIPVYDQIVELEAKITGLGAEGSLLAGRLIRWVPELVEAEYLRLAADNATDVESDAKTLIDELLTVTEKSPTLDLEAPKPPKA